MRSYRLLHLDVFTDRALEGNQLAVFPDARDLEPALMQRIAREMNLSETVFFFKPTLAGCDARLRIFTPMCEIPFAGHPTIGATWAAHHEGIVTKNDFVFQEEVGPVPVSILSTDPFMAYLTTPPIAFKKEYDRAGTAAALGLDERDLLETPVQCVSAGPDFVYVAVRDRATVDRAWLDYPRMQTVCGNDAAGGVFVFAPSDGGAYSRMFAPEHGIVEDPATGSATGPLAAYMQRYELLPAGTTTFVSEQGVKMGRPSVLHVRIVEANGEPAFQVGGSVVPLIEGTLTLPD
jgi:trans-2,3-dihydro-3-hydroxyanthranilate isomerase